MKFNRVPKLAHDVSAITFGCWELGGGQWEKESDETNLQAIEEALKLGINTFDTAEGYGQGHSEEIVGEALAGKRGDVVIATKVSPNHLHASDIRRAAEASLKRLRTDYIDIYYVHWPNKDIPLEETMTEFRRLQDEGMIRAIAVSNFSRVQLEEAETFAKIDVLQPEYSLLQRGIEQDIVPYCVHHNISIMTYSSVAKGILTGVYHLGATPRALHSDDFRQGRRLFLPEHVEAASELVSLLKDIADAHHVAPAEVAIAWLLAQKGVTSAIVGTQNVAHLKENVRSVDVSLTSEQLELLDATSQQALRRIDG